LPSSSKAIIPFREVSRKQGDIEVAESGIYAVGSTPSNESFITVSVVKEVLLVNYSTGGAIRLEFTTPDMLDVSPSPPDSGTGIRPDMVINFVDYEPVLTNNFNGADLQQEQDDLNTMLDYKIAQEKALHT